MDENLPAEWDQFFANGGEIPDALKPLQTPVEEPVVAEPVVAEVVDPVAEEPVAVPTPVPSTAHYDRLLKAQQDQADLLKQQLADLQAKFTKATETPAPDEATDPLGFLAHQMKAIKAKMDAMQTGAQQTQQQTAEQTQFNAFINTVNAQVAEFKKMNAPDYDAAYKHLVGVRTADYTDRGMSAEAAREAVNREEMDIAAKAVQMGKNPAELCYNMAKRYGYVSPKPAVAPENKLDTIKKGLETGKDLERAAPPSSVTNANLREMSDKDLSKLVQSGEWETLFGKSKDIFGN